MFDRKHRPLNVPRASVAPFLPSNDAPSDPEPPFRLTSQDVTDLNERFAKTDTAEILIWAWERFGTRAAVGTAFQGAGLVMLHQAKIHGLPFPVFTVDTGLLFPETLALKKRLEDFFGYEIESLHPDLTIAEQEEAHGANLWDRDPDLCCTMRKVFPLRDKLSKLDCWITGLRREQSDARASVGIIEIYKADESNKREIVKVNPMALWKRDAVWAYIREHKIPYNPLHDVGYRSIGCITCTRKTSEGEHERAGRWTGFKKLECGIHTFMSRKNDFQI
jgi:phosphoadenosine phosphosulfate reductase